MKIMDARLSDINNYLPSFLGSNDSSKTEEEELNYILLHAAPNGRVKQAYLQGWYFEVRVFRDTYKIFKRMETAEKV